MFICITEDDFARNIEKTLATILNKKEKEAAAASGGEDTEKIKDEGCRRGRKRRKHEKDRKVFILSLVLRSVF